MGYYVSYNIDVVIPKDKVRPCLAAINALHSDENLESRASGGQSGRDSASLPLRQRKWYSFTRNPGDNGFMDLLDAFTTWRFEPHTCNEDGDIALGYWNGEKLGDESILFETIAPFVKEGGTIEAQGEEGEKWRFLFTNGQMKTQQAVISWK